jgi:hypothetical protein
MKVAIKRSRQTLARVWAEHKRADILKSDQVQSPGQPHDNIERPWLSSYAVAKGALGTKGKWKTRSAINTHTSVPD